MYYILYIYIYIIVPLASLVMYVIYIESVLNISPFTMLYIMFINNFVGTGLNKLWNLCNKICSNQTIIC